MSSFCISSVQVQLVKKTLTITDNNTLAFICQFPVWYSIFFPLGSLRRVYRAILILVITCFFTGKGEDMPRTTLWPLQLLWILLVSFFYPSYNQRTQIRVLANGQMHVWSSGQWLLSALCPGILCFHGNGWLDLADVWNRPQYSTGLWNVPIGILLVNSVPWCFHSITHQVCKSTYHSLQLISLVLTWKPLKHM